MAELGNCCGMYRAHKWLDMAEKMDSGDLVLFANISAGCVTDSIRVVPLLHLKACCDSIESVP